MAPRGGAGLGASAPARRGRIQWRAYLYVLPAFAVFAAFLGIPLLQTAGYSLWHWNGLSAATWAGADNYARLLADPVVRDSFAHAMVLLLFYSAAPVAAALVLTAVLARVPRLRGLAAFRTALFLPQVVASVVVAVAWVAIYSPEGLANRLLRAVGLGDLTRAWLGGFDTALVAVGLIGAWMGVGLCLVLFLAGLSTVDAEVLEAARLDGAGLWREFVAVTLPALRPQIAVALTVTAVSALRTFDLVYVTTGGGPGTATTVPSLLVYERAFGTREVGSAAAIAVVLVVLILLLTVAISRLHPREPE